MKMVSERETAGHNAAHILNLLFVPVRLFIFWTVACSSVWAMRPKQMTPFCNSPSLLCVLLQGVFIFHECIFTDKCADLQRQISQLSCEWFHKPPCLAQLFHIFAPKYYGPKNISNKRPPVTKSLYHFLLMLYKVK